MKTNRLLQLITGTVAMMLMAVMSVGSVQAQDYYVNISGGDDTACNGSSSNVATVPNCPFETIDRALTAAAGAAGTQTIQVAAGNYTVGNGEAAVLDFDSAVNLEAAPFNANTIVTLAVDLLFDADVAMSSEGATFSSTSGVVDLFDGTLTLEAGVLTLASGTLITRTDGDIAGAAPVFGANTFVTYDGGDTAAGLELPADLGTGTLLVDVGVGDDFSASADVTATLIDIDSGASVAFTGDVTADDVDVDGAGSHSFADVTLTGGDFTQLAGAGDTSVDDLALGTGVLAVTSGTFESTGTVSNSDAAVQTLILHSGAGMDLNNVTLDFAFVGDAGDDSYVQTINNTAGVLTISGTMTESFQSDADEDDESIFSLDVDGGEIVISQANTLSGFIDIDGGEATFSNGGVLNGDVDNDTVININGGTLELTSDVAAFLGLGVFEGDGKLLLSGDANVDAGGIVADGDVELGGTNDAVAGSTLLVNEGDILISGDADWSDVTNDIEATLGSVTITGDVGILGGDVTAGGDATFEDGDGVDGALDVGGSLVANSDVVFAGTFTVDGDATLNGDNEINGVIDVGGDFTVGGDSVIDDGGAGNTNDIAGDLIVDGTLTFTALDGSETSVDNVSIAKNVGSVVLNDNDLNVAGDWDGGFFTAADGSIVTFAMSADHTFAPGPNTVFDDLVVDGNERTLTATGSFEVAGDLSISDDATLDITSNLLTMSGDDVTLLIAEDAFLVANPATGAVSFTGSDTGDADAWAAVIDVEGGTASITSFIINTGDSSDIFLDSSGSPDAVLTVTGVISLVEGGFTLSGDVTGDGVSGDDDKANELAFTTDNAGIIVNLDGVGTDIEDNAGVALISGVYDLTYNGTAGGANGDEYDVDSIDDLTINAGGVMDLDPAGPVTIAGDFTVDAASTADLGDDLTVEGAFNIAGDVTDDGGTLFMDSATAQTHSLTGDITSSVTFDSEATVNGSDDDGDVARFSGPVVVNAAVSFMDIQAFEDDVTVGDAGAATVHVVDADDTDADAAGEDGTMDDVFIDGDGSFTLASDISVFSDFTVGDDTGDPVLNMAGFDLIMYGGDFGADGDADLGTTGTLVLESDADVTTDQDGDGPSVLPNLTVNSGDAIGDVSVTGTTDINEDFDGDFTLTVSGTVFVGADVDNDVVINGTTIEMEGSFDFENTLTIDATTVDFVSDDGTQYLLTVFGTIFMVAGDVSLDDVDLETETTLDYDGGTFAFGDSDDMFVFDGATLEGNENNVMIANVQVEGGALVVEDDDTLTIGSFLNLFTDIEADTDGTVVVGDSEGSMSASMLGGNIDNVDGTVTFGTDILTLIYDGTTDTMDEFSDSFFELQVDTAVDVNDDATVDVFDVNADVDFDAGNVTVSEDGIVQLSGGAGLDDDIIYAGAFNLVYDGLAGPLGAPGHFEWDPGDVPASLTILDDWLLDVDRQVVDVTADGAPLDLGGAVLSVSGTFSLVDGGTIVDGVGGGTLALNGAALQTVDATGDIDFPASILEIDNPLGVTLTGGDIDFRDGVPGTVGGILMLTDGTFSTGDNFIILDHGSTAAQGYVQTDGTVFGNIQKEIVGGTATADRMQFPVGTADGDFRPVSLTFNNPGAVSAVGASGILITAEHVEMSPGGNNNMPLTTTDDQGNVLEIARYPDFFWNITSSATLSPNVDYDIELRAAGYNEFVGEDIEKVRTIRRQGGATTNFWTLVGPTPESNDNFAVSATEPVAVVRDAVGGINSGEGTLFTMGLESNFEVLVDPTLVTVNAGATVDVDLSTVFSGGTGVYTYTVTSDDSGIATGAAAGLVLTVTGVTPGVTTLTVVATDELNDQTVATVEVTVTDAFTIVEGADDAVSINVGDSDVGDLNDAFQGGAAPITYVVASDDPAIATITLDGDEVTLTGVAVGTTEVTITATDFTGAVAVLTIEVTVNDTFAAVVQATVELTEGDTHTDDVADLFTGGAGPYTYVVTSAAPANVAAAEAGGTLTIDAVDAYAGGTTVGVINVTITATDATGAEAVATVPVDVFPVLGDLTGSGGPSAASAQLALEFYLDLTTLTAKQQVAADFNVDGLVTPFDAALIFQAIGSGKRELAASVTAVISFGDVVRDGNLITVPLYVTGDLDAVGSVAFETLVDPTVAKVTSITSKMGDGWISGHSIGEDGQVKFALAGMGEMTRDGQVAVITLELVDASASFSFNAQGAVNNNTFENIDAVEVVELPDAFSLHGNYPNPFNPSTTIQFDLPETADVEIQVVDLLGRVVMTLPSQTIDAGTNRSIQLNASQLASGTYFYRVIAKMESRTLVQTNRMMLVK